MLDEATMAIATGAAGNVVAYMLSGRVDALRERIVRVFRRAPEEQQEEVRRALDTDATALADRSASQSDVSLRWAMRLAIELHAHPDARPDIAALAALEVGDRAQISIHTNTGSGPYVAGNNNGLIFSQTDRKPQ